MAIGKHEDGASSANGTAHMRLQQPLRRVAFQVLRIAPPVRGRPHTAPRACAAAAGVPSVSSTTTTAATSSQSSSAPSFQQLPAPDPSAAHLHALFTRRALLSSAAVAAAAAVLRTRDAARAAVSLAADGLADSARAVEAPPAASTTEQPPLRQPARPPTRVTWGYLPENGPEKWASLSDEFSACGHVGTQSPIALSYRQAIVPSDDDLPRPKLSLVPGRFIVKLREAQPGAQNKSFMYDVYMPRPPPLVGDAPPVDSYRPPANPAVLSMGDGKEYILNGFHFHAPHSEHAIDGNLGAIELHFVFQQRRRGSPGVPKANAAPADAQAASPRDASDSASGKYDPPLQAQAPPRGEMGMAVIGVIFDLGAESSPWLRNVLDVAVQRDSNVADFPDGGKLVDLDLSSILPDLESTDVFEYNGSLTTPPGTEGIKWIILGKRETVSLEDVELLEAAQGGPNVRPLQALGDRRVLRFPAFADQITRASGVAV